MSIETYPVFENDEEPNFPHYVEWKCAYVGSGGAFNHFGHVDSFQRQQGFVSAVKGFVVRQNEAHECFTVIRRRLLFVSAKLAAEGVKVPSVSSRVSLAAFSRAGTK